MNRKLQLLISIGIVLVVLIVVFVVIKPRILQTKEAEITSSGPVNSQQVINLPEETTPDTIDPSPTANNLETSITSESPPPEIVSATPSPMALPTTGDKPGNTTSSIAAIGSAAMDGEWEYFWAPSYDYNLSEMKGYLCRIKSDGTECHVLVNDDVCFINVVGDWVYYIKKDSFWGTTGEIYRIKKSGGEKEHIYNAICTKMTVVGDKIYFINVSDNLSIYSLSTDGTQAIKLCDIADCVNLLYENQMLFLTTKKNDNKKNYRYDLTENQLIEINIETMDSIYDGWIYFRDGEIIYKVRYDGTEKTEIIGDTSGPFVIINKNIIYISPIIEEKGSNEAYGLRKVYRYDMNTKEISIIPNENKVRIHGFAGAAGDYVYYRVDYVEYEGIIRMKYDGTEYTDIQKISP